MLALPIFTVRLQTSIFGRSELNFRVRNGNGWTLALISTNLLSFEKESKQRKLHKSSCFYFSKDDLFLHPENRTVKRFPLPASVCISSSDLFRSSPRLISIGQLHTLPHFHLRPIYDIVYVEPYSFRMRDLILGGVSRLDAFSVYLVQT